MDEARTMFNEFAEKALANHVEELNTQYNPGKVNDPDLIDEAFKNHSLDLEKELDTEIDKLLTEENMEQRTSFLEMKEAFLKKLNDARAAASA